MQSASAKNYALDEATTNITIDSNGLVHVEEAISYSFEGHYKEVFRTLKVLPGESIQNITGHCSDKTCNISINPTAKGYDLIALLPDTTPEKLTFFISYDRSGAVRVHRDISEFHYKLWGEEWDRPLGSLKGRIVFPEGNGDELQYWIHPASIAQQVNSDHNVINIKTGEIPANQWYEIRVAFPRIAFTDYKNIQIDNEEGLKKINEIENKYKSDASIVKNIYNITIAVAIIALLFPIFIYYKYGREPEINYNSIYEREPPTDSKPAIVNALLQREMGVPSMDSFTATIMELASLGYISIHTVHTVNPGDSKESNLLDTESEDILIEISDDFSNKEASNNRRKLEDFEEDALNLLKSHASRGKVSWQKLKRELGTGTEFYKFIKAWKKKVKAYTAVDKLFQSTGNEYIIKFGLVIGPAAAVLLFMLPYFFPVINFPDGSHLVFLLFSIIVFEFILAVICLKFEKIFGCFTPEGKLYYERWKHFKKYLTDFSALKEHPPESIKLWDHYLVYATAMGVAEEVIKNMSLVVPSDQLYMSTFYPVHGSSAHFSSGFGNAYASSTPSAGRGGGSGIGGIGGGFGGGGGGAV